MAHQVVVAGLQERAGILQGEIKVIEDSLARERMDLAHVMATLRMFQPDVENPRIYPRRSPSQRSQHFVQGEITRRCREALRDAKGPIMADDIAVRTMAHKGLGLSDEVLRADLREVSATRCTAFGKMSAAEQIGHGISAHWQTKLTKG